MGLQNDGDGDHRIGQRGPEDRHQHQRQQKRREGQHDIHDPHDDRVEPFRREARDQADDDPAGGGKGDDDDADIEGIARAVQQPRQHVAAQRIGAKREGEAAALLPEGRLQQVVAELLAGIMRRDPGGEQRHDDEGREDPEAHDGAPVLAEVIPELAQAAGTGGGGRGGGGCLGHQRFRILGLMKP